MSDKDSIDSDRDSGTDTKDVKSITYVRFRSPIVQVSEMVFSGQRVA